MFVLSKLGLCNRLDPLKYTLRAGAVFDSLWYEGEWTQESPHGYGKLYDEDGKLKYEGEFVYGTRHGWGKLFADGDLVHSGLFNKDSIYFGEWDLRTGANGVGRLYADDGVVTAEGEWQDGELVLGRVYSNSMFEGKRLIKFAHSASWIGRICEKGKPVAKGLFSQDSVGKFYRNQSRFLDDREKKELELMFEVRLPQLNARLSCVVDGFRFRSAFDEIEHLKAEVAKLTRENETLRSATAHTVGSPQRSSPQRSSPQRSIAQADSSSPQSSIAQADSSSSCQDVAGVWSGAVLGSSR